MRCFSGIETGGTFPEVTTWSGNCGECQQNTSSFGEFCASLKGDDEKPRVNRFRDRRRGSGRTNLPHSHRGGYPSHAERRTADAHTGTTVSSACDSLAREGVCSRLHRGRGALRGGVSDYVACALAVYGVGTLWLRLLAGREQASARACVCRKMSQFQHRKTSCIPAQRANG